MTARDRILLALLAAITAAICWAFVEAALALRAWGRLPGDLVAEVAALREDALGEMAAAREDLRQELALLRQESLERVDGAVARADQRLADALERADKRIGEAIAEAHQVSLSASQTLEEARAGIAEVRAAGQQAASRLDYWTDCQQNGLCWQGALTDSLLSVRQAALEIRRAAPEMAEAARASARGVEATAAASAATAANLAQITRPGPRWLRYLGLGLSVAAPASQVALPFVLRKAEVK